MKAALNGVLNLSISDGWWDELYDGHNGWTIPSVGVPDDERRDDLEAAALYDILADRVVPLFYQREGDVPDGWVDAVRHTLSFLGPRVQATRMVRDYVREYYGPAVAMTRAMTATGDWTAAKDFAAWQDRVRAAWPAIRIVGVDLDSEESEPVLGHPMTIRAYVDLGGLLPDDVAVEAVFGRVGAEQELTAVRHYPMDYVGNGEGYRFQAEVPLERAGALGYTVRILPHQSQLASPAEMGLVTAAS
jgi:starch phosphorylase